MDHPGDSLESDVDKLAIDDEKGDDTKHEHSFFRRLKDQIKSSFPEAIQDLKLMGSMTALETGVKKDIRDSKLFPEIERVAEVRCVLELCPEEMTFLEKRKHRVRDAFVKYIDVPVEDVHPDDVPS